MKNSESNTGVRRQLSPEFECIERMCKTMWKATFAFDGWYIDSLLRTSESHSYIVGRFIEGEKPAYYLDHKPNVHETFFSKIVSVKQHTQDLYISSSNLAMILFLSLEDIRISESL